MDNVTIIISIIGSIIFVATVLMSIASNQVLGVGKSELNNIKKSALSGTVIVFYITMTCIFYFYFNEMHYEFNYLFFGVVWFLILIILYIYVVKCKYDPLVKKLISKCGHTNYIRKYEPIITGTVILNALSALVSGYTFSCLKIKFDTILEGEITNLQGFSIIVMFVVFIYTIVCSGYLFSYRALLNLNKYTVTKMNNNKLNVYLIGENKKEYIFKEIKGNNSYINLISKEQITEWKLIK